MPRLRVKIRILRRVATLRQQRDAARAKQIIRPTSTRPKGLLSSSNRPLDLKFRLKPFNRRPSADHTGDRIDALVRYVHVDEFELLNCLSSDVSQNVAPIPTAMLPPSSAVSSME